MALNPPEEGSCAAAQDSDLQRMLREWYKSEHWRHLPLFLWLKGDFVNLDDVYTHLEIQGTKTDDYRSLFLDDTKRILIEGEAGIGKSTLLKKIALDWANGELKEFDHIFSISLRAIEEEQKLEEMIVAQSDLLSAKRVHPNVVLNILEEDSPRTVLLIDGLDETCYNKDIQDMLQRRKLWDTFVVVTTRPHSSEIEDIRRLMGRLAKIVGFSHKDAKHYIRKILEDEDVLKKFMDEVDRNNLRDFLRVPFIALALSLVYLNVDPPTLPTTMTGIYEKLVECFVKNCGERSDLSSEATQAAMDELADLAFNGLMRKTKQLIFKSEEITIEVYQLGILSGQRQRMRLDPGMIVEFPHKSVQEFMGSKSAVRRLSSTETKEDPLRFLDTIQTTSDIFNWKLLLQFMCGMGSKSITDKVVHKAADKCADVFVWVEKNKESILFSIDHYLEDLVKESSVVQKSLAHCNKAYLSHKCVQHKLPQTLRFVPKLICLAPLLEVLHPGDYQKVMSSIPRLTARGQSPDTILHVMGFQLNQPTMVAFTEWITAIPHLNSVTLGHVDVCPDVVQHVEACKAFATNIVRPTTQNLVINGCTFPTPVLVALLSNLMVNTEMKEFSLVVGSPNSVDWETLTGTLHFQCPEKMQDLTLENLHMYLMTDTARESDMTALSKMISLKVLSLHRVSFQTAGPRLARAMAMWPPEVQLTKLDLTRCYIQNDAAKEISAVIANCRNIKLLLLAYNNFHHCASIMLPKRNKYPNLALLDLHDNGICGEDLVTIGDAMFEGNFPQLSDITFSDLADVSEEHVHHFLLAVERQPERSWKIDLGRTTCINSQFRKEWQSKLKRIRHFKL